MTNTSDKDSLVGLWCYFSVRGGGETRSTDAVKIGEVEEIGMRFGAIPYIRFRAAHNQQRVIELLGSWTIKADLTY